MSGVNKAILVGNLGRDPEMRYTASGTAVANLSLATSRTYKDRDGNKQEDTEWHRCVAWARTAEIANQYLARGSQVYIEGRIQTREWEDEEGQTKYTTEIVVEQLTMLGRASDNAKRDRGPVDPQSPNPGGNLDDDQVPF